MARPGLLVVVAALAALAAGAARADDPIKMP
jgi:hypothetical protein